MNTNTILTVLVAVLASSAALMLLSPSADADDTTQYYTYSPTFVSTAQDAQYVAWDFGDGTVLDSRYSEQESVWTSYGWTGFTAEKATAYTALLESHGGNVWMPKHTYAAKGTYTTSQTVYNDYDGGSTDTVTKAIRIMGHPTITFVTGNGTAMEDIEVPKDAAYNAKTAERPEDPVRDGFTFDGWYTDSDFTTEFDWTAPVSGNVTLHAKWAAAAGPGDDDEDGGDENDAGKEIDWFAIALVIVGIAVCLCCMFGIITPWIAILGLISITAGALMLFGVI